MRSLTTRILMLCTNVAVQGITLKFHFSRSKIEVHLDTSRVALKGGVGMKYN